MIRNVCLAAFLMLPFTAMAQEQAPSVFVKWVAAALCAPNSAYLCTDVNPQYVDVVPLRLAETAAPIRLDHETLRSAYTELHSLQQQAKRDAGAAQSYGPDEYLAHLYWERSVANAGKARCNVGSVACFGIAAMVAALGGPPGVAGGAVLAGACYVVSSDCTSKWDDQLYIVDRAIAEYDKCAVADKECQKRAFEKKNIKPVPIPSPLQIKQQGDRPIRPLDGSDIGGTGGKSSSSRGGSGGLGSGFDNSTYKCVGAEVTVNGKAYPQVICGWS
jgi:hypothetical protein